MEDSEFTPKKVKSKLIGYIKKLDHFLFNEKDLQIYLAMKFKEDEETKVYTEYHLPKGCNEAFDAHYARWATEKPSIDIVLEFKEKFIGIELKYKLDKVTSRQFNRFGNSIEGEVTLVTKQSAQNNARYDFWKDVKRLELLSKCYNNVVGGVAILVTNDFSYQTTDPNSDYRSFGLGTEKSGDLIWYNGENKVDGKEKLYKNGYPKTYKDPLDNNNHKILYSKPNFSLESSHTGNWDGTKDDPLYAFEQAKFICYNVVVEK